MLRFQVTRPDGSVLYQMILQGAHGPILIGKLWVKEGKIVMQSCSDYHTDQGSVVHPADGPWVGDMAFSVKEEM